MQRFFPFLMMRFSDDFYIKTSSLMFHTIFLKSQKSISTIIYEGCHDFKHTRKKTYAQNLKPTNRHIFAQHQHHFVSCLASFLPRSLPLLFCILSIILCSPFFLSCCSSLSPCLLSLLSRFSSTFISS